MKQITNMKGYIVPVFFLEVVVAHQELRSWSGLD
jgi:hypothetical protein